MVPKLHIIERLTERMREVPEIQNPQTLLRLAESYARLRTSPKSVAMKVAILNSARGFTWPGDKDYRPGQYEGRGSNGSEVWVIAREGNLVTIMFRRTNQPSVATAFDVHQVVDLTGETPRVLNSQKTVVFRPRAA